MRRYLLGSCLVVAGAAMGFGQDQSNSFPDYSFPDNSANHWVFQAIQEMKGAGLPVEDAYLYPDTGWGRRSGPKTRYELTVETNSACFGLHDFAVNLAVVNDRLAKGDADALKLLTMDLNQLQKDCPRFEKELLRMVDLFAPILPSLGVMVKDLRTQCVRDLAEIKSARLSALSGVTKLFADVPTNHWAASAVLNLRSLGVLNGYPPNEFRGAD